MERTATARQMARIRQLCCLGLGSELLMPEVLKDLHALVPSCGNTFFWVDTRGHLGHVYDEHPDSAATAQLYLTEFHNRREREVAHSFSDAVRLERGVLLDEQFLTVDLRTFYRSDFYNQVLRPIGYDRCLHMVVREGDRTLGFLQLQRSRNDPVFSAAEIHLFRRLQAFIAHGMTRREPEAARVLVESGASGLVIVDRWGHLVSYSPQGRRLLNLAVDSWTGARGRRVRDARLPDPLASLCRRLQAVETHDANAGPPVLRLRNAWGGFVFRAYRLETGIGSNGHIGITVTHAEPLRLRLVRGAFGLSLSSRQAEVAVMVASGLSHQQIADRLGISRHTVITHARWVYNKLAVHDGFALRERLLASAASQEAFDR